jgi:hypothetical protein
MTVAVEVVAWALLALWIVAPFVSLVIGARCGRPFLGWYAVRCRSPDRSSPPGCRTTGTGKGHRSRHGGARLAGRFACYPGASP